MKAFEEAGIPCGPIYTVDQVFDDPQVKHLGMAAPVVHPRLGKLDLVASPINFEGTPRVIRTATPEGGQDTDATMSELGYSPDEIATFRKKSIIT